MFKNQEDKKLGKNRTSVCLAFLSVSLFILALLSDGVLYAQSEGAKISPLDTKSMSILNEQRAGIADIRRQLLEQGAIFETTSTVDMLQLILDRGLVGAEDASFQEAIGVAIGDIIVKREGFVWAVAEDEWGRIPVVVQPQKSIFITPISSVQGRFGDGQTTFDVEGYIEAAVNALDVSGEKPSSSSQEMPQQDSDP